MDSHSDAQQTCVDKIAGEGTITGNADEVFHFMDISTGDNVLTEIPLLDLDLAFSNLSDDDNKINIGTTLSILKEYLAETSLEHIQTLGTIPRGLCPFSPAMYLHTYLVKQINSFQCTLEVLYVHMNSIHILANRQWYSAEFDLKIGLKRLVDDKFIPPLSRGFIKEINRLCSRRILKTAREEQARFRFMLPETMGTIYKAVILGNKKLNGSTGSLSLANLFHVL